MLVGRERMLVCDDVWKVYGPDAAARLEALGPAPDDDALAAAGLIGALRGVTLTVARGEVFVVMGLSGSGKSTLVRCLTRLIEPERGAVLLDGINLGSASARELIAIRRHKMSMVFQNFALLPHLTVLDNIAFPLKLQGVALAERLARAATLIETVGLAGRESHYPHELSGGQQQRVGIARSLANDPEVWFLDEPFSALDPLIRHDMQSELLRLQAMFRKTVVFITHDFAEAVRLAGRIAIMRDGKLVQIGTPEQLVLTPADDYVRAFTRGIDRARVLTAGAVADAPAETGARDLPALRAGELVADVAERVIGAGRPLRVEDEAGACVGALGPARVLHLLLERGAAA